MLSRPGRSGKCGASKNRTTHNYALTERATGVHVRDTRMDVHGDRLAVFDKYLLEQHARNLARLNISIRHKEAVGPIGARPALAEAALFGGAILH